MTLNTRAAHTRINNTVDCDGVQLTNARYHMVPIPILWYIDNPGDSPITNKLGQKYQPVAACCKPS